MVIRILVISLLLSGAPAQAYLDPGTGSMLLQGLLATVAASMLFLRGRWVVFKTFFCRLFRHKPPASNPHDRITPPDA